MSPNPAIRPSPAVDADCRRLYAVLSGRAEQLNAGLWFTDPAGNIALAPTDARWRAVAPGTRFPIDADMPPGVITRRDAGQREFYLLCLAHRKGSKLIGFFVAACEGSEEHARTALSALTWSYQDRAQAARDAVTIEQFSEKLGQSYEEAQLLFRVARLINQVQRPLDSIQGMITQLHAIMPFGWISIQFSQGKKCLEDLRGRTLVAGTLPVSPDVFFEHGERVLMESNLDGWTRIEAPSGGGLAALTGSEVLREPLCDAGQLVGVLLAGNKGGDDPGLGSFETQIVDAFAEYLGVFHQNAARFAEERAMFLGTLRALTASIDAKDAYTRGHSERVGLLAMMMARAMNLSSEECEQYRIAGLVHDVGKIGVPEGVLCKAGKLTDAEFAQIQRHPEIGYHILKDIASLQPMLPGVLHHHEKWNGRGYPHALAGEEIPVIARVLALADTFDAMSSNRSYRSGMSRDHVLAEVIRCAGMQFDPQLAPMFAALDFTPYDQMMARHEDGALNQQRIAA